MGDSTFLSRAKLLIFVIFKGIAQGLAGRAKGGVDGKSGNCDQDSANGNAYNGSSFHKISFAIGYSFLYNITEG